MPRHDGWAARLNHIVRERQQQGLLRQRRCVEHLNGRQVRFAGQTLLQFASNDYLGLAFDAQPVTPQGAAASALVSGYQPAHRELEKQLCEFTGYQAALLFSSGYAANSAPLSLLQSGDRILADKLIHTSVIDAAQHSVATLRRFPHNNMAVLARWLAAPLAASGANEPPLTLVATESLFSMDGDQAPLAEFTALARQYGALSWVDDAHGFGILGEQGRGCVAFARPDLLTVTFGKALGGSGAALLGSHALIEAIMQRSKHYVYSTTITLDQAQRVQQRLAGLLEPAKRRHLQQLIDHFRAGAQAQGWQLSPSQSPIQPLLCADSATAMALSARLQQAQIWVPAIRPPTVPQARLRIVFNACHQVADVDALLQALGRAPSASTATPMLPTGSLC